MEKPIAPFTAVLMAGGKSTRMGRDKATLTIDGAPLWQRQIETLRALEPAEVLISGPADGPWRDTEWRAVPDAQEDAGPLGGLIALLAAMQCERAVVLAVDLPAMTPGFLRSLVRSAGAGAGVVPEIDGRLEPLAAVYPRSIGVLAAKALQRGELSLQPLVRAGVAAGLLQVHAVTGEDRALFRNVNTPADLVSFPCTRT